MTNSRNVPGQAGGYYLQETRLLYHLLKANTGDTVSLEYLGDVAVVHEDGSFTTEEDKSAITDNPVTDRSVNLWKTLHNWILSAESGDLDPELTRYILYVPHKHFTGPFIKKFHDAKTLKEATEAVKFVKTELWGSAPKYILKDKVASSIATYAEIVFFNERTVAAIIKNFKFERGADAGFEEIIEAIKNSFVPPEHADVYRRHMLGWVKEKIDLCIAKDLIPQISKDEFMHEGHVVLRKFDRERILESVTTKPSRATADAQVRKAPKYIRQLDYINLSYEDKVDAVCDYYTAESDRYAWIERGMLHESSADEFDTRLKLKWKNVCGEVKATMNHIDPEQKGAAVYFKCRQYETTIEGCAVEDYLIHGTYHLLADEPSIGWHPNWSKLITDDADEDES